MKKITNKFKYETEWMSVSYETEGLTGVYTREVQVTVDGKTETQTISQREASYIQDVLNNTKWKYSDGPEHVQEVGDKICEAYYSLVI